MNTEKLKEVQNLIDLIATVETAADAFKAKVIIDSIIAGAEKPVKENLPSEKIPVQTPAEYIITLEAKIYQQAKEIEELKSKRHITLTQAREMALFTAEKADWYNQKQSLEAENERLKDYLIRRFRAACLRKLDNSCGQDNDCNLCDKPAKMVEDILKAGEK